MPDKQASIPLDEVGDRTLTDISAADFVSALDKGGVALPDLMFWPEKKKVELWAEPENLGRVRVVDVIRVIRVEKKKVEREFRDFWNRGDPPPWRGTFEPHPEPSYRELVEDVARVVEGRLRAARQ